MPLYTPPLVQFTAVKNGTQSITNSGKVTSLTVQTDSANGWNSGSDRYDVKIPGVYEITMQTKWSGNVSSGICAYAINGGSPRFAGDAVSADRMGFQTIIYGNLVAGDYIEFYAYPNNSNTLSAAGDSTWFAISRVG